jgi:hypothetical protein
MDLLPALMAGKRRESRPPAPNAGDPALVCILYVCERRDKCTPPQSLPKIALIAPFTVQRAPINFFDMLHYLF